MAEEGAGNASDVPWASVFDPAVNVRALGEIQARGFRAATELVDRFVRMADRMAGDPVSQPTEQHRQAAEKPSSTTTPDLDKLVGTWQAVVGQWAGSVNAAANPAAERATVDLVSAEAVGQLILTAEQPGAVSGEVWLHNGGGEDLGKVRLRCGDLMSHDGTVVPDELIRFEPDPVLMPARCSRGVTIQIDVADDLPAGRYRGILLADGYADVWLPLTLVVASAVR